MCFISTKSLVLHQMQLSVTRPKSPKLTRRKSMGDAVKSCSSKDEQAARRSVGSYREDKNYPIKNPKGKDGSGVQKLHQHKKVKNLVTKDDHPQQTTHKYAHNDAIES